MIVHDAHLNIEIYNMKTECNIGAVYFQVNATRVEYSITHDHIHETV